MYLGQLTDDHKKLFLDAAIYLSMSDGNFALNEKNMIDQMCREMQIPARYEMELGGDALLSMFTGISSERQKRIILVELGGIVLADQVYDAKEKEMLCVIARSLGYPESVADEAVALVEELYGLYVRMERFLESKSAK